MEVTDTVSKTVSDCVSKLFINYMRLVLTVATPERLRAQVSSTPSLAEATMESRLITPNTPIVFGIMRLPQNPKQTTENTTQKLSSLRSLDIRNAYVHMLEYAREATMSVSPNYVVPSGSGRDVRKTHMCRTQV